MRPGQHVALIGGYTPDMREADDATLAKAHVWIDSRAGLQEAGDLIGPMAAGILRESDIRGTLPDLCAIAAVDGREETITLFKSVGDASQDMAAAAIALR